MHVSWNIIAFQRNFFLKFLKLKSYEGRTNFLLKHWGVFELSEMEIYMYSIYRARGGTQKHTDNERMTHCRHWQKAHSSGPSLQSGFAVSAHRAVERREKGKTEGETKGITTMLKTFPHHLTSTPEPTSDGSGACLKSTNTL